MDSIPNRKYIDAFNTAILKKEKQYFGALFLITEHTDLETAILVEKFNPSKLRLYDIIRNTFNFEG